LGTGILNAVDGRNPAPVDRWLIPLFTGFYTSQVVQDFFHQLYGSNLSSAFHSAGKEMDFK